MDVRVVMVKPAPNTPLDGTPRMIWVGKNLNALGWVEIQIKKDKDWEPVEVVVQDEENA